MGEAKNRQAEIEAFKAAQAELARQQQVLNNLAELPSTFVNAWIFANVGGIIKLGLLETPAAGVAPKLRFAALMHVDSVEAMCRNGLSVVEDFRKGMIAAAPQEPPAGAVGDPDEASFQLDADTASQETLQKWADIVLGPSTLAALESDLDTLLPPIQPAKTDQELLDAPPHGQSRGG